jgi:hypothetical protein
MVKKKRTWSLLIIDDKTHYRLYRIPVEISYKILKLSKGYIYIYEYLFHNYFP